MGVYKMVTVQLECDHCRKTIGKLYSSTDDMPFYASAQLVCQGCLDSGVAIAKGSSDKETLDFIGSLSKEVEDKQ